MGAITRTHKRNLELTDFELTKEAISRRCGEFALIDASVGSTFLTIAETTQDAEHREKCIYQAGRALHAIDRLLQKFKFGREQHNSITEARANLATRLCLISERYGLTKPRR